MKNFSKIRFLLTIVLTICVLPNIIGCTRVLTKENLFGINSDFKNTCESFVVGRWDFEKLYTDVKEENVKTESALYVVFYGNYTGKMVANRETLAFAWEFIQCKENVAYFRFVNEKNIAFFAITPIDTSHVMYNKLTIVLEDSNDATMLVLKKQ